MSCQVSGRLSHLSAECIRLEMIDIYRLGLTVISFLSLLLLLKISGMTGIVVANKHIK